LRVQS